MVMAASVKPASTSPPACAGVQPRKEANSNAGPRRVAPLCCVTRAPVGLVAAGARPAAAAAGPRARRPPHEPDHDYYDYKMTPPSGQTGRARLSLREDLAQIA